MDRRPALGKGLSALIPDAPEPPRTGPFEVDIDLLAPNEHQPRVQIPPIFGTRGGHRATLDAQITDEAKGRCDPCQLSAMHVS